MRKGKRFWWLLDNVASPIAPVHWFGGIKPGDSVASWLLAGLKALVVAGWAVGFLWLWFVTFWALLLWDTFVPDD